MEARKFILISEFVRNHLIEFLQRLDISTLMEVTVKAFEEKRSNPQNNRLWLLHTAAARFVGCSPEDMHEEMLCKMFGCTEVRLPSGYIKRVPLKRSSQLGKKDFGVFMEQVEAFYISELGVWLDKEAA